MQSGAVDIRVRPEPRMVLTYEMNVSMKAPEGTIEARVFIEEKFVRQAGDTMFWDVDTTNVIMKTTGGFAAAEATMKEAFSIDGTYERDARHRTKAISIGDFRVPSVATDGSSDVVLPDRPVKVGDRWPGRFEVAGKPVNVQYEYRGPHSLAGAPTYLIVATFQETGVTQTKPYTFHVAQDDGRTVLASGGAKIRSNEKDFEAEFTIRRTGKYTAPQ